MNAVERKIAKADGQAEAIEAEIAQMSALASPDFAAIGDKTAELSRVRAEREELETEWLELGEALEA